MGRGVRIAHGLGATRRIILADTLLDNYSDDEIEAVLAHELGHHVHRHILKSIFVQALITLLGFWAANLVLHMAIEQWHMFDTLSDKNGSPTGKTWAVLNTTKNTKANNPTAPIGRPASQVRFVSVGSPL